MAIPLVCGCGRRFDLKNEFAGQKVMCPECGGEFEVPAIRDQAEPVFEHDKFLLKQKRIAINEKYTIHNERNEPIVFVERPTYLFRAILGAMGVVIVILAGTIGSFVGMAFVGSAVPGNSVLPPVTFTALLGLTLAVTLFAAVNFFPKRHISFYGDKDRSRLLLSVQQDSKWQVFVATYSLFDAEGLYLANFSKNVFTNLFRKRWRCTAPDGEPLCTAFEDSVILALARRFLGTMMGLLRTNFVIVQGSQPSGPLLGEFNRKFTLFDRYVLDLSHDATRSLDRRVAIALGVLLDTGERR
jgi:hypothetical protein